MRRCVRCDQKAWSTWTAQPCANGKKRVAVPLCKLCDFMLNDLTVRYLLGDTPKARRKLARYRKRLGL